MVRDGARAGAGAIRTPSAEKMSFTPRHPAGAHTYSNRLVYFIAGASGSLTCGLLSIVLSYFFLSAADLKKTEKDKKMWCAHAHTRRTHARVVHACG